MSLFRELFILNTESEEIGNKIAIKVIEKLPGSNTDSTGLKLITRDRLVNYDIYNKWVLSDQPQDISCFGRSVLHRMDYNLRQKHGESAEDMIAKRLLDGSRIKILFLDPKSEFIRLIAKAEGRDYETLLDYIARSIGVCKRLHDLISNEEINFDQKTQLHIRLLSGEQTNFSYHKVDEHAIIGFYMLSGAIPYAPSYEILNKNELQVFDQYFYTMFHNSKVLLELLGHDGSARFDESLYELIYAFLCEKLPKEKVDGIISGEI